MSVGFFFAFLIWLIVAGAIYAIIKLLLPAVLANFGGPGTVLAQAVRIILWAVLMIIVVYIIWDLVECLMGPGGLRLPRLSGR